ncbi:MAG: L,D-transpeptidase family protein [Acidimicrobiales bacterium]
MHTLSRPRAALGAAATVLVVGASFLVATAGTAGAAPAQVTTTTTPPTTTTPATTTTTTPPAPPAPPAPVTLHYLPLSGATLSQGARGGEVFLMQVTLSARGFWLSDFPGAFGASTTHALTAFQKYSGLPRSGRLDPLTRFVLGASMEKAVTKVGKTGRFIEVDLGRQILTISDNGVVMWVFDISSGKKSTPTPRGSYRITRQINGQRVSALGQLWRPKYFTGGYALHGSPSVPNYPASHGCVRMTNQEINFLWDSGIAPVGTPVTLF